MKHRVTTTWGWLLLVAAIAATSATANQRLVNLDRATVMALPRAALHKLAEAGTHSRHTAAAAAAATRGRSILQAPPSYPSSPAYGPPVGVYGPADPPPPASPPPPYPPAPASPTDAPNPPSPTPTPPSPAPPPSPPTPPSPAPPNAYPANTPPPAQGTPRPSGSQYYSTPATATLDVSPTACSNIASNSGPFAYQFQATTAAAWNAANPAAVVQVMAGDVAVTTVSANGCSASKRQLLQGSSNSIGLQYQVNLPPGATQQQAESASSAYQARAAQLYTQGQFSNDYGVSRASVSVGQPSLVTVPNDSDGGGSGSSGPSSVALGVGLGIGLGVPILAGIWYVYYRRRQERQRFGAYSHSLIEFGRMN